MEGVYSFIAYFSPSFVAWLHASKYALLFLGCIFEGPVVMVASGFLYRLGGLELIPMYLVLMFGDFTADIMWYCIGRFGAKNLIYRYGGYFGITPRTIEKIQHRFQKYHDKILIISKLTMGFGFALVVLVVAGMSRVPFKKYAIFNLLGGFIWTAVLITVGYFFGDIFAKITGPEKIAFAISGFMLFFLTLRIANNYLSKIEI